MIKIDYVCGFANRLFQYCIANILARHHGLMLPASPINGIPQSFQTIAGVKLEGKFENIESPTDVYNILNHKKISRPLRLNGLFQQSSLYLDHQSEIRESWIKLDSSIQSSECCARNDLVIHVRRGDYLLHNWGAPFSFFEAAIESTSFDRMCIVTDDRHDPFLRRFDKYKPSIVCSHYLSDFALLTQAKKIIMSPSTFSWWAAFISYAEEIFFPIPQHGIWSKDYCQEVDLALPPSYPQYKYIECVEPLRLSAIERLYFERKYLLHKLRAQGIVGYFKGHAHSAVKLTSQLMPWTI